MEIFENGMGKYGGRGVVVRDVEGRMEIIENGMEKYGGGGGGGGERGRGSDGNYRKRNGKIWGGESGRGSDGNYRKRNGKIWGVREVEMRMEIIENGMEKYGG